LGTKFTCEDPPKVQVEFGQGAGGAVELVTYLLEASMTHTGRRTEYARPMASNRARRDHRPPDRRPASPGKTANIARTCRTAGTPERTAKPHLN